MKIPLKTCAAAAIAAVVLCSAALADVLGVRTDETNLYLKPGAGWTDNRITRGAAVELTGQKKDGWYPVRMRNGEEGWVAGWLAWPLPSDTPLPPAFSDEDIPTLTAPLYGRVIADNVSFRTVPYGGLSGKWDTTRAGAVPKGALLKITDRIGHWLKVQFAPAEYGWVYDEAFEPAKQPPDGAPFGIPAAKLDRIMSGRSIMESALTIKLEKPLPYYTGANVAPDQVAFKIYGVDCSQLRWRWHAHCGKAGGWCECRPGANALEGVVPAPGGLAGYDAGYAGNDFSITMKVPENNPVRRIVLDPGHGAPEPYPPGYADGAKNKDCAEKEVVLDISRTLAALLKKAGHEVFLTRDGDSTDMMDLYKRIEFSDKKKADLFVSVHANGDSDTALKGVEVYWYDPQNRPFAEMVAGSVVAATGQESGIAAFGSFAVIRPTRIPAVLVETGYMSNPDEGKLLCDSAFRKKTAAGIADGILKYIESLKSPPKFK